tara:strand:+ start:90 stop:371 length:282 start_codon:yes stop_codon:yes gene_type:complete
MECQLKVDKKLSELRIGDSVIWFSYETPIAFKRGIQEFTRVNDWSSTTGRHLNSIDGGSPSAKARRISGDEFLKKLSLCLVAPEQNQFWKHNW